MVGGGVLIALWGLRFGATSTPILTFCGIGFLAVAIGLGLSASRAFQQHKTPILPDQTAQSLITTGAFSVSRNPIYLAMALILLALGALFGTAICIPVILAFVQIVTRTHIEPEEAMLKQEFPTDADHYFNQTPRWFGPI